MGIIVRTIVSCSVVSGSSRPMDCSWRGSFAHGILQTRILEWVAILFSRGSSQPRDWTQIFCISRQILSSLSHQGICKQEVQFTSILVRCQNYPFVIPTPCKVFKFPTFSWGELKSVQNCKLPKEIRYVVGNGCSRTIGSFLPFCLIMLKGYLISSIPISFCALLSCFSLPQRLGKNTSLNKYLHFSLLGDFAK